MKTNHYVGKTTLAIDGSLLAFRASAAGEKRSIIAKIPFDNRTAFKEWMRDINSSKENEEPLLKATDFEIEDVLSPIEEKQSFHIAKEMIQYMMSACQADQYEIYLDAPEDTFRHKLATVQEYKGTRHGKVKPSNLQAVKDYLVVHHGAKVVHEQHRGHNIEVDDYINMLKWWGYQEYLKDETTKIISCSFDKDDLGNDGWSFDFRKDDEGVPLMKTPKLIQRLGSIYYREKQKDCKGEGRKFLYYQVLDQDSADNYKARKLSGKRYSAKKAFEALDPCKTDKECWEVLVKQFKEWYPEEQTYTAWYGEEVTKGWMELLQEYFDLARMLRWGGDDVMVKDVLDNLGVDYEE